MKIGNFEVAYKELNHAYFSYLGGNEKAKYCRLMANCQVQLKHVAEAHAYFDEALNCGTNLEKVDIQLEKGQLYARETNFTEAINNFQSAIDLVGENNPRPNVLYLFFGFFSYLDGLKCF